MSCGIPRRAKIDVAKSWRDLDALRAPALGPGREKAERVRDEIERYVGGRGKRRIRLREHRGQSVYLADRIRVPALVEHAPRVGRCATATHRSRGRDASLSTE
jgi:hypothetical protein